MLLNNWQVSQTYSDDTCQFVKRKSVNLGPEFKQSQHDMYDIQLLESIT